MMKSIAWFTCSSLLAAKLARGEQLLTELAADDECATSDDASCALNALHVRGAKTSQGRERAATGCHDIKESDGGECWRAIMWAMHEGMATHPEWYPGFDNNTPIVKWQFQAYNTTHPKCPRPCSIPEPEAWCKNLVPPTLWAPSDAGASMQVKVLSYNLFWWHLYKVEGGRGNSAGNLVKGSMRPHYDVMGFQECEDPVRVLGPVGLLEEFTAFQGTHAICMAYRTAAWSLVAKGETDVAEDMKTEFYGSRGTQWMRLQHKATGRMLFFVNHHGPLSVNSGGLCGGQATAYNLLAIMARHAQVGDTLVLVGDFNANAASRTIQSLWPHLHHVYNSKSFGGVDNIFSNVNRAAVVHTTDLGSGGSDHHAISAVIHVGPASEAPAAAAASTPEAVNDAAADCHTAVQGEGCWNEVQWAMHDGYSSHPEWYPGLDAQSGTAAFQAVVHQNNPEKCPKPCSEGGATLGASAEGSQEPNFSVDVLEHAHGSDACLLEPQVEYVLDGGWSHHHAHVTDPRVCCRICEGESACSAWTWTDWSQDAHGPRCSLWGGNVVSKKTKDGSVSGLPKMQAIREAAGAARQAMAHQA
eukprot:gb/GFBE01056585.1/.p1 GENE.gb/GFBE01056585.1/~~gb/GFBE01056585.1/.p1  ORF type:complete len:585 (+),score=93.02 gb/GFBE01056585.1/:1-1755(+)